MVKYYFFPKAYEIPISQAVESWSLIPDSFIVTTGTYKRADILDTNDSLVFNKTILQEIIYIKKGYLSENNEIYGYIGFCLEADLQTIAPEYQAMVDNIPDILQFNSANDYLEWLQTQQ